MTEESKRGGIEFIRHSRAGYKTYAEILQSDNPQARVDPEHQNIPDLPEAGIELAREKAAELLAKYDPAQDAFFFVSSDEARALETANIYRETAHSEGFEIIKPEQARSSMAERIGEGEIRVLKNLSLGIGNMLIGSLFNSSRAMPTVNWGAVDPEVKKKWEMARAIIDANDEGSFGANFFRHSEAIQKFFPEIKTARRVYETRFRHLMRLARFAFQKIDSSQHPKKITVLAFGHENYFAYALDKYFQDHAIGNCDTVHISLEGDRLQLERKNKKVYIDE